MKDQRTDMIVNAIGALPDFLIDESAEGSEEMKNRNITKWATIAAVFVFIALTCVLLALHGKPPVVTPSNTDNAVSDSDKPSDSTSAPESESVPDTDAPDTDTPDTDAPETDAPVIEPHDVTVGGATYRVYADHAVVIGLKSSAKLAESVEGVPVTDIEDDAFKSVHHLSVTCSASSAIYEKARSCAIACDQIFLESDSGKVPDHYYPDWVVKLNWHERDRSGDDFLAVDDNARITELVGAYLGGDESAQDELLRRVIYRAACAEKFELAVNSAEEFYYYTYDRDAVSYDDGDMTDWLRYEYISDGIPLYYQYAYGSIDTYEELHDYICTFYTEDSAKEFLESCTLDVEGLPFMQLTGRGSFTCKNLSYDLEVESDAVKLTIGYEDWGWEEAELLKTSEVTVTLENHGGKWQLTCDPFNAFGILSLPAEYVGLYGTSAVE